MRTSISMALVALTSLVASSAGASVILSDNFNRTAGVNASGTNGGLSSWGDNNNALGGASTMTYKVRSTAAGSSTEQQFVDGNLGRLRLGHGVANLDLLSVPGVAQHGYQASFNFQRGGGGYVAFALGLTPAEIEAHPQNNARIGVPFAANIPETDFGFLFRPGAASELWRGGVVTTGPAGIFNATSISGSPTSLLNSAVVEVTPAVAGQWGAGSLINLSLTVNGGSPLTYTFTSDGSGLGYFGFHSNAGATVAQAGIDNLVISVVPEPATLGVLAGGVALLAKRRKH
jgi:hypothetical protein